MSNENTNNNIIDELDDAINEFINKLVNKYNGKLAIKYWIFITAQIDFKIKTMLMSDIIPKLLAVENSEENNNSGIYF
jgi:hypothetical protein